jgi:uncharacterized protein YndB with AHSA1/START domain
MTDVKEQMGSVTGEPGQISVHLERIIKATPEEVWSALTEPARLARWLAEVVAGEVAPGAVFDLEMNDDPPEIARCKVRRFEPPTTLEMDWDYTSEGVSRLRFTLAPAPEGTLLTLEHDQLPTDGVAYGAGWHAHLDLLIAVAEGRDPPSWSARFDALFPEYRALVGQ